MGTDSLTPEDVKAMAAEIGITGLADEHVQQLVRATNAARARRGSLRVETLTPADEPAHVFRLGAEVVR